MATTCENIEKHFQVRAEFGRVGDDRKTTGSLECCKGRKRGSSGEGSEDKDIWGT